MNYQILNGKNVVIGDTQFYDVKVKKDVTFDGSVNWYVNGIQVKKMDLAIAINIVESEQKPERKWYKNLGMFFLKRTCENTPEYGQVMFKFITGLRIYGFNKCGIYYHFRFFKWSFEFELCWKNKEKYENNEFPDGYVNYLKII